MKKIRTPTETLNISVAEERVLRTLARHNYACGKDHFETGSGNYKSSDLLGSSRSRLDLLGIHEEGSHWTHDSRALAYFHDNPRRRLVIVGDRARVDDLLEKLDNLKEKQS
jgi:hypothetical protein